MATVLGAPISLTRYLLIWDFFFPTTYDWFLTMTSWEGGWISYRLCTYYLGRESGRSKKLLAVWRVLQIIVLGLD
jgi:hypothetical protein